MFLWRGAEARLGDIIGAEVRGDFGGLAGGTIEENAGGGEEPDGWL